jgi:(1->4)-alpha-D-glucan 1-alpha-D-glucosylmutase
LGVWSPHEPADALLPRIQAYLVKATREAKRATSWMNPNAQYEQAVSDFAARLLEGADQNAFLKDFTALAEFVNYFGHLNSLAQTILKLTSPGVPDIYQGTEAMSLALVDPDNRRPVDYIANARLFDELSQLSAEDARSRLATALASPYSSDAKLFVTSRLLQLRRELTARRHEERTIVVVIAKWMAQLMNMERQLPIGEVWGDTTVGAPARSPGAMRDIFTGEDLHPSGESVRVAELFKHAPFAVLVAE